MIFQDGMDLPAGALQFAAARFALRLNRIFGTAQLERLAARHHHYNFTTEIAGRWCPEIRF